MSDYTNIENFTNKELIEELNIRGCIEMIDYELDIVDQDKLNRIIEKFTSSSWVDRDLMFKNCCS
jgi:hypothetical protein